MRIWLVPLAVWLTPMAVFAQTAPAAVSVAVVAAGPEDAEVAQHLTTLEDVAERELALVGDTPHAWLEAAATLDEPLVVVIQRSESVVHVLRPADGTVLTRQMDPGLSRESAVAVALVTAELVGVARQLAAAAEPRAATPPTPPTTVRVARETPEQAPSTPPRSPFGGAFGAGLSFTASPGHDVSLFVGAVFAELQLLRGGPAWLALGGTFTTPGTWTRELGGPEMERVDYSRFDLSFRAGAGFGTAATRAVVSAVLGVSFVDVRALAQSGAMLGEESSAHGSLGLALSLRQRLWEGLFVSGDLGAVLVPEPTRYLVRDVPIISEGHVRLSAALYLGWEV